jgi:predicted DCC family thiol-disulfide oxidoreductase YuxK
MSIAVIYDGLCMFCIQSLRIVRALDIRHELAFYDANERERVLEAFPSLAGVDLDAAMYVVDQHGLVYPGFYGFRRIAWTTPLAWWLLPILYFPGASIVGTRVYALIARNRGRLGCRVDEAEPDA